MLITILVDKYCKEALKAKNGLEAVQICRNNPDIDFILMDIKMPEMDGYEATKQIRLKKHQSQYISRSDSCIINLIKLF
jgi:CheY-like chemotaxis protein